MKELALILILGGASVSACGAETSKNAGGAQEQVAVLKELAQRSQLPESELSKLLANCDADQQSMHFCAWRDQIAADQAYHKALAAHIKQQPQCEKSLSTQSVHWLAARDQDCDKSSRAQWSEGSMQPTGKLLCITAETQRRIQALSHLKDCSIH